MEAARREAETAKARSAQSAVAAIPDVDVEVYYAHRAEGYDDMAGVMFSVDLPLFQSKRQDKDYAADVSRSMQAVDQLTLLKREHIARANAGGAVSGCANGVAATAGRGTTVAASTAGGTDGAISLWTVGASGPAGGASWRTGYGTGGEPGGARNGANTGCRELADPQELAQ